MKCFQFIKNSKPTVTKPEEIQDLMTPHISVYQLRVETIKTFKE